MIKSSRSGAENTHFGIIGELNGFTFHLEKSSKNGERLYWICAEKHSAKCKARLTTDLAYSVVKNDLNQHPNHFGSAAKVEAIRAQESMERRAVETMESTSAVVNRMRQGKKHNCNCYFTANICFRLISCGHCTHAIILVGQSGSSAMENGGDAGPKCTSRSRDT